jgi:N-acetylglucosaminyldiphosphoundecaprenol N-acetyl-beta-D-mannosaminyltransferase
VTVTGSKVSSVLHPDGVQVPTPTNRRRPSHEVATENQGVHVIRCFGLPLVAGTFESVADWLIAQAQPADPPVIAVHVNVYNYYLLHRDPSFRRALEQHCTFLFDGVGLKLGARLLGQRNVSDVNGTDLFPLMMRRASERGLSVFFVGGTRDVSERAVSKVAEKFPELTIAGSHPGYFSRSEAGHVVDEVRRNTPDLLLVGRGSLVNDDFILRYKDEFRVPLIWNVGGLFDFVAGVKPRAPAVVRAVRLEWLFRFALEPRRMWHRNIVAAPWFIGHALHCRFGQGAEHRQLERSAARPLTNRQQCLGEPTASEDPR